MHARKWIRPAFSVIELLIVLAIIAFLIALLVPAIQKVREAAARTQSINNLKQIGLSFHSFHDVLKSLPFNGSDTAVGNLKYSKAAKQSDSRSGSWGFMILPFIEQGPIYNEFDKDAATNQRLRAIPVPVFHCPVRSRMPVETSNGGGVWTDYFLNNYINAPMKANKADNANVKRTLVGVADGTSNTVMVGHGNISTKQYKSNADVAFSSNIYLGGTFGTARGGNATTADEPANPGGVTLQRDSAALPNLGSWGGPLPQGALIGMCDGTVRLFPYNTQNFSAFLTPFGGEAVNLPDT